MFQTKEVADFDRLDYIIKQHISDKLEYANTLYEQGQVDTAQWLVDDAYKFAELMDNNAELLWMRRIAS
jgi:hypothetical protein